MDNSNFNLINKSVCIVAYASYMKNKNYGSIIDSHDTVVRINNGINILNKNDFGTRTDIGYIFFGDEKINLITKTYNEINNNNLKINQILKKENIFCITCSSKYKEYIMENLYYYLIDIPYLTSGISSIIIILKLKPKTLYITGFSFDNFVYPSYILYAYKYKKIYAKRANKKYSDWNAPHSELFEKYLVKKLCETYNFITLDTQMNNILHDIDTSILDNNIYYTKTFKEYFDLIQNMINS